jgi:pimeloyl-ACP methyl ester carboxylesterase
VLLHGFPETWFAWRKQIPALAEHYSLIVPDLRGYGDTAKPDTGYDKQTMATDVRELLRRLGHDRVALVGHDRGARVATRFAKDHRDMIELFDVLEIWRGMAHDVRGVSIPQCAHLPHEERPDVVNSDLLAFLSGWKG